MSQIAANMLTPTMRLVITKRVIIGQAHQEFSKKPVVTPSIPVLALLTINIKAEKRLNINTLTTYSMNQPKLHVYPAAVNGKTHTGIAMMLVVLRETLAAKGEVLVRPAGQKAGFGTTATKEWQMTPSARRGALTLLETGTIRNPVNVNPKPKARLLPRPLPDCSVITSSIGNGLTAHVREFA